MESVFFANITGEYHYFNKWKLEGVFDELMDKLHVIVRNLMGVSHHVDSDRGIDGNKKIKGQKLIDDARTKLGAEFKVVLRPDESSKKTSEG